MPGYKRKRSGPGPRRPYKRYKRRPWKARASGARTKRRYLRTMVKNQIQASAEKKQINADPQTYTFAANNVSMSTPIDLTQTFLQIQQGVDDGERIGEQVRTKKAILKCLVQAPDVAGTAACAILQLFVGYVKDTPGTVPTSSELLTIFDDGGGVAPANGLITTLLRNINTDVFRIHAYRQVKVGLATAAGFTNNDFPAYRKVYIDMTKVLGVLKYSQASNNPTNKHWYLFCNWVNPEDGTTTASPSTQPPRMQYYMDYTYTDV